MAKHRVPQDSERQLRDRALFHEADLESKTVKRKAWKHDDWSNYTFKQLESYPVLLDAAAESLKVSRIVSGSPSDKAKMLRRFELYKLLSPSRRLAAVIVPLHELDFLELKSQLTLDMAKMLLYEKLTALGVDMDRPHSAALKRGGKSGGTHAHTVFQAEALGAELLALAGASAVGAGGGALHASGVHVCLVGDAAGDLKRLAAYNSRDGDEALHLEDQDAPPFLAALSRKVAAQINGVKAPALIWHHPERLKALPALSVY